MRAAVVVLALVASSGLLALLYRSRTHNKFDVMRRDMDLTDASLLEDEVTKLKIELRSQRDFISQLKEEILNKNDELKEKNNMIAAKGKGAGADEFSSFVNHMTE